MLWTILGEDYRINRQNGLRAVILILAYRTGHAILAGRAGWPRWRRWALAVPFRLVRLVHALACHSYGCFLPLNARLGRRVEFRHAYYGIFISGDAVVGDDVILFHQVTLGSNYDSGKRRGAPALGDRVLVGAGAKVIGGVTVGADARIGANCVVVDDLPEGATAVLPKARILPAR